MSDQTRGGELDIHEGMPSGAGTRPFLQVWFRCANAYQRVYRNRQGTGYGARCPKCGKTVRFQVGPGGTHKRMFEVSC